MCAIVAERKVSIRIPHLLYLHMSLHYQEIDSFGLLKQFIGHYINVCPTIGDPAFDNRPRFKRTTGIPKMFLQKVEDKSGANSLLVTQTGDIVVARPDESTFEKMVKKTATYGAPASAGDSFSTVPVQLTCKLCQKLLSDAVDTPCCHTTHCDSCIRSHLLDNPSSKFKCPSCRKDLYPDGLLANKSIRAEVDQFVRDSTRARPSGSTSPVQPSVTRPLATGIPAESASHHKGYASSEKVATSIDHIRYEGRAGSVRSSGDQRAQVSCPSFLYFRLSKMKHVTHLTVLLI